MSHPTPAPDPEVITIGVQDGQYVLESSPLRNNAWPDPSDGLTTGEENWLAVITGTQWGDVSVEVRVLMSPPATLDTEWEMVVERDLATKSGEIAIRDLYSVPPIHAVRLSPGLLRVRVHVRGRSGTPPETSSASPAETHLIQMWPVKHESPATILAGPDSTARSYR